MSAEKLYKVIVDGPIGFQTINQLADNAADLRTQMLVEHGANDPLIGIASGGPGVDYHALGRHDLDEIPRSVGYASLILVSTTSLGVQIDIQLQWTGPGMALVEHQSAGAYTVKVIGLSKFWAKVSPVGGSTVTYLEPQVRAFAATPANGNFAGLRITTYGLTAGAFVPTDMSMGIAIYGTP